MESFAVLVPTLNASAHLDALIPALQRQTVAPNTFLVVDSSSTDDTRARLAAAGATVHQIPKAEFNHGRTRQLAIELAGEHDFYVFLTQDAIPAEPEAFARLLEAFATPTIGMAYGRQLPRNEADAIEQFARKFNYGETSHIRTLADKAAHGVKTAFCSNSFAAYRRVALSSVGGFTPERFAEDQIVAARMLLHGWHIAYQAEARVVHSHGYTLTEEFRRYLEVGAFHGSNPWLAASFGDPTGEGLKYVTAELGFLAKRAPEKIPQAIARSAAKFVAYKVGQSSPRTTKDREQL